MSNVWTRTTIADCCYLVRDSVSPESCGGSPYIGLEHIGESSLGLIGIGSARDVTSTKSRFRRGDILFGKLRPYFRKIVRPNFDGICSTDIWVIRSKRNIDAEFLFYVLACSDFVELATRGTEGTRMPRAKWDFVSSHRVSLPSIAEQRRVAEILGALDDRVELNRRMCEMLEEMAQALYKSWFVDFEPVRAKMEGRWREGESVLGLPAETYDIFPNQLVDSRLGTVPAGWNIEQLGDSIELEYGKALKASERKYGPVPVYGSNGQIGWHDEYLVKGPGIIVGRKGNPGTVRRSHADFFPIDTTFYAVARDAGLTFEYLYCMLQRQQLPSVTSDSAVPGLNRNLAYANLYARPSDDAIAAFTEAVSGLWCCEQSIQASSQLLGDLRDTLLPKLISGELRVPISAAGRD